MICHGGGDNILARLLPGAGLVHALAVHVVVRAARLVVLNIFVWKQVNFLDRKEGNTMAKNSQHSDRCSDGKVWTIKLNFPHLVCADQCFVGTRLLWNWKLRDGKIVVIELQSWENRNDWELANAKLNSSHNCIKNTKIEPWIVKQINTKVKFSKVAQ